VTGARVCTLSRLHVGQLQVADSTRKLTSVAGGMAVSVGHDIFTDIAYEGGANVSLLHTRHVYISSVSGSVYQIDYDAHCLEAVFQLHSAAINSLAVNEGFAITGSDDKILRVWPIDFTDYFLEAEHETPVTSVGIAPDGLQVCTAILQTVICECFARPLVSMLTCAFARAMHKTQHTSTNAQNPACCPGR
jgi:WD40 repeat protein